jgi:cereblon
MYDEYELMRRVVGLIARYSSNLALEAGRVQRDPTNFSFWLASNLALDDKTRSEWLRARTTLDRLRMAIQFLESAVSTTKIKCRNCQTVVGDSGDLFRVGVASNEGVLGTYVNSAGYVHETLTLTKAQNLTVIEPPTAEFSWFPGYAWMIAYCSVCHEHMGWKFVALSQRLQPQEMWGLTRASVTR